MVVRTGLNTTMGNMVRELIAPSHLCKQRDSFMRVRFHIACTACLMVPMSAEL